MPLLIFEVDNASWCNANKLIFFNGLGTLL